MIDNGGKPIGWEDVKLYHGECLEVLRSLPNNSVDLILTDPPYG